MTRTSAHEVRIPPRFCDAQGMVHASRYPELVEDAFLGWLDDNDLPYDRLRTRGIDLVIGRLEIDYRTPARLGDSLTVTTGALTSTRSTVRVGFVIERHGTLVAEAAVIYIAVQDGTSTPLPDELR